MKNPASFWFLAWGRLALNPNVSGNHARMGRRPRGEWARVEAYAKKRQATARDRIVRQ